MDAAQALTGGSSHNQPVHTPRAVDRCGSQDTSQATLPNTQTDKVPADPKVQLRRVLQQTPFLSESVPLAPGGKEKPDRQDFPAQAPAPTQGLSGGPHRRESSAPSCPAALESQQEDDGQGVSVWLKFIFFVRSQALGLLLFKICTFYIQIKYVNTYKKVLK